MQVSLSLSWVPPYQKASSLPPEISTTVAQCTDLVFPVDTNWVLKSGLSAEDGKNACSGGVNPLSGGMALKTKNRQVNKVSNMASKKPLSHKWGFPWESILTIGIQELPLHSSEHPTGCKVKLNILKPAHLLTDSYLYVN